MKKIRYLNIQFHNRISSCELPYFRAAVIEHSQRLSNLFHNHTEDGGYIYRYPLIQYKRQRGRAAMVCLEQGADDIHLLFQQPDLTFQIGKRREAFSIDRLSLREETLACTPAAPTYHLCDWLALNQENYKKYQAIPAQVDRLLFLQKVLTGHILGMAEGIGWEVDRQIQLDILQIRQARPVFFKKQKVLAFSLDFRANVRLPEGIGLGKGNAVGFGVVGSLSGQTKRAAERRPTGSSRFYQAKK